MAPYIILLIMLLVFSIIDYYKINANIRMGMFYLTFISLFLFSGLRYDVGMDYSSYEYLYNESLSGLNPEINEPGWAYFFHFFKSLDIPFFVVILIISFISILCVSLFILRYSPYPFLSFLIFFCFAQYYTYSFNVMRQCLSCYIFLVCLKYIEERKLLYYWGMMLVSTFCVHVSAIVLLPLYFILHKRVSFWLKIFLLIIAILCSRFIIDIFLMSDTYRIYLNLEQYSGDVSITTYLLLLIGVLLLFLEYHYKRWTPQEVILLNISYLYVVFLSVSFVYANTPLIVILLRIAIDFTPVLIVLIPIVINKFFFKKSRLVLIILLSVLYGMILCYTLKIGGDNNKLVPYKTILWEYV